MPTTDVTIAALAGSSAAITTLILQVAKEIWINRWIIPDEQRNAVLYGMNYLINAALLLFFLQVGGIFQPDMLYVYLTLGLVQSGASHFGYTTLARGDGKPKV